MSVGLQGYVTFCVRGPGVCESGGLGFRLGLNADVRVGDGGPGVCDCEGQWWRLWGM